MAIFASFGTSVRPSLDLRDGSWDHYETLGHHKVPSWDDARHFEILKKSKMAAWRWKTR